MKKYIAQLVQILCLYTTSFCVIASQPEDTTIIASKPSVLVWRIDNKIPPKNFSARQKEKDRIKKEKKEEEQKAFRADFKPNYVGSKPEKIDNKNIISADESLLHKAILNYDPNKKDNKGNTALHIACNKRNSTIVKMLLSHHEICLVTKNNNDETAFFIACRNNSIDIVHAFSPYMIREPLIAEELLKEQSTFLGLTPLHSACMHNDDELFFSLLNIIAAIPNRLLSDFLYLTNHYTQTPLHIACIQQQISIARLLIMSQPDLINSKDSEWSTPLHYAVENGCAKIIKLLLKSDLINLNIQNDIYLTPLHIACMKKNTKCAQLLLAHPNILPNKSGCLIYPVFLSFTPPALHIAVKNNDVQMVKVLLKCPKINRNIGYKNMIPLDIAQSNSNSEIVALLTQ